MVLNSTIGIVTMENLRTTQLNNGWFMVRKELKELLETIKGLERFEWRFDLVVLQQYEFYEVTEYQLSEHMSCSHRGSESFHQ